MASLKTRFSLLFIVSAVLLAVSDVSATIYGIFWDVVALREKVYRVNPSDGSKTAIGSGIASFQTSSGVSAFSESGDGQFFVIGTVNGGTTYRIYTIDAGTGQVVSNPALPAGYNFNFLAFDAVGSRLLGVFYKTAATKEYLVSINTGTGAVTEIGAGFCSSCGVPSGVSAIDSAGGRLFFIGSPSGGNAKIYTINISTGVASSSPDLTTGYNSNFIEYDTSGNRLLGVFYKSAVSKEYLVSINTSTGAVTEIGSGISGCCGVSSGVSTIDSAAGRFYFIGKPTAGTSWKIYAMNTSTGAVASNPDIGTETALNPNFLEHQIKETPVIIWANPASIVYGTALSAKQLNATASVPGAFVYTPAAGTGLGVGTHTLSTTFSPTDSANYTTATKTATITVKKATPVITWANPGSIVSGTALSATQLNATASVPGTFVYTPPSGTVLFASATLSVAFTPSDGVNYASTTKTVPITVTQVPFTDPTLTSGVSVIKAVHITELRTRINAVRVTKGLGAYAWTEALTPGTTKVKATHIVELRTALTEAYAAAKMSPPTFANPVPAAGAVVTAAAILELRAAVVAIE